MSLRRYLDAARRSVGRHGGGSAGVWAVLRRAMKVIRAMGLKGLISRLQSASKVHAPAVEPFDTPALPDPAPLRDVSLRVGVMAHVYYPDLIEEFAATLSLLPVPYTLLVSVVDADAEVHARQRFASLPNLASLVIKRVENRGRDIAPLLVTFHDEVMALDLIGHIHTKKSLYTGSEQEEWRRYLLNSLFGSTERLAWIFGMFQADARLGMVYPESHAGMPLWGHTLLSNADACDALAGRMGIALDRQRYLDFPAGSMFWARVDALRPIYELHLRLEEFPAETGQTDGTLQHAVERLLGVVTRHQGYRLGILPADGRLALPVEGERNMAAALDGDVFERLQIASLEAELVTVDVFDTLVVRAFLTPAAAREHLAWRLRRHFGVDDFARQREDAEVALRARLRRDPVLAEIHEALAQKIGLPDLDAAALAEIERSHEKALLRPRTGVLAALQRIGAAPLTAFSDMYLSRQDMQAILPATVVQDIGRWWISCETGRRKDSVDTWQNVAREQGRTDGRWLHVGDNEHSDIQLPQQAGLLTPVHVLRPAALLDVVPGLRPLRHPLGARAPWQEQLWRGLIANRFAEIADTAPRQLLGAPVLDAGMLGYTAIGPLVLDFLLAVINVAKEKGIETLLFLSREGHLLQRAFVRLQRAHATAATMSGHYFLVSRRATLLPSLRTEQDLARVVQSNFNGSLESLLRARLGDEATDAVRTHMPERLDQDVFLPEMSAEVEGWLAPALPALLSLARQQREAYNAYHAATVSGTTSMLIDIGYAGSIQRNLAQLLAAPQGGYYMALSSNAHVLSDDNWAYARYFDGRHSESPAMSTILSNDLLLESLLAAPHGQFNGFTGGDVLQPTPNFGPIELSADGINALANVHAGALEFIDDVCTAIGEDVTGLTLDPAGVQIPLQCIGSGRWDAKVPLALLATEDAFTGRGKVSAGEPG
ncbi:rhamnan synthesis F family protein [uncultured Stenotrophomonas sp.]|uniref:rhamnan synthesis F family protein n=1 Tax=uncultured Stenotrophomonas sp. TaxID=165438 RepID=UPI0028E3C15D|nr:rhamnan synthesis F family protein [uncultured Stenotrophomonas sp.]